MTAAVEILKILRIIVFLQPHLLLFEMSNAWLKVCQKLLVQQKIVLENCSLGTHNHALMIRYHNPAHYTHNTHSFQVQTLLLILFTVQCWIMTVQHDELGNFVLIIEYHAWLGIVIVSSYAGAAFMETVVSTVCKPLVQRKCC